MTRRVLVGLLGVGLAVLSFDALRAYALGSGVIPDRTIVDREWLAALWAVVVDLAVLAGIIGVNDDRKDWRAWLMLLLALVATFGFQVFAFDPMVARAVPPVGLALAILVLDLGPARAKPDRQASGPPAPARFHRWLRSWDDIADGASGPVRGSAAELLPAGQQRRAEDTARPRATTQRVAGGLTAEQQATVRRMHAERQSGRAMARELGLSNHARAKHLAPFVAELEAARAGNGARP